MSYGDDGLSSYPDPETGERVTVDWSATVEQGRQLVHDAAICRDDLDAALDRGPHDWSEDVTA